VGRPRRAAAARRRVDHVLEHRTGRGARRGADRRELHEHERRDLRGAHDAPGVLERARRRSVGDHGLEVRALAGGLDEHVRAGGEAEGADALVGGGNTGFQIAQELAARREVHLSIGSRQLALPQRVLGRDLFRYLEATGLMRKTSASRVGWRMRERETLIGSSPPAARRRHGIHLRPRTVRAAGAEVTFADGTRLAPPAVIWATGFELDHGWIDAPVFDERGAIVQDRGVTSVPGLSFLGLPWMRTRGSALLGWVGEDAEHLARVVAV
jgi:putative flavoprotein involved in K+ transport